MIPTVPDPLMQEAGALEALEKRKDEAYQNRNEGNVAFHAYMNRADEFGTALRNRAMSLIRALRDRVKKEQELVREGFRRHDDLLRKSMEDAQFFGDALRNREARIESLEAIEKAARHLKDTTWYVDGSNSVAEGQAFEEAWQALESALALVEQKRKEKSNG